MKNPLISVIVPTFNRENFIGYCIDSILEQTYQNFELIIVDDGSNDSTKDILQRYYDKIKIIRQENKGVSAARNNGLKIAKGDYIAFCDSDDTWLSEKLAIQVNFFDKNPQAIVCYTEEIWIRNGKRVNQCKHHRKFSGDIFEKSLHMCIVSPSSVMMKRTFFDKVGTFDESLPACEDYDLWLRASSYLIPFYFIETPLIRKIGGHEDQLSHTYWGMDRFRINSIIKCLKHFSLSEEQRQKACSVLEKKCSILYNGAKKRDKCEEAKQYLEIINNWCAK